MRTASTKTETGQIFPMPKSCATLRTGILLLFHLFFLSGNSAGQEGLPAMRTDDRVRIAEAMNISSIYGEQIWKGLSRVPFTMILVTDSVEFLTGHPSPTDDFTCLGHDSLLASDIYFRKRVFGKQLLATFPAVKGVNTIVVGTPENTGKNSTDWIITLLHEHFHQYTYGSPGYFAAVDSLSLSGGDQTGMWMLNFPFPYADSTIGFRYRAFADALLGCLGALDSLSFYDRFSVYRSEREHLTSALSPADYRYFSFQVWQEGLARYAEFRFLGALSGYTPSHGLAALSDFVPFDKYRSEFYRRQYDQLAHSRLDQQKRVCFYAIGFAEGQILDKVNPSWRDHFLRRRFYIEKYFRQDDR